MTTDIHAYLVELEAIPDTRVFTAARSRQGYFLNQLCMSLMTAENPARFKADHGFYDHADA